MLVCMHACMYKRVRVCVCVHGYECICVECLCVCVRVVYKRRVGSTNTPLSYKFPGVEPYSMSKSNLKRHCDR